MNIIEAHKQLDQALATHTPAIAAQERIVADLDIRLRAQSIVDSHKSTIFPRGRDPLDARILIIDDESKPLSRSTRAAEENGHTVRQALSSVRAIQILNDPNIPVDLIVCDGLDGEWKTVYSASSGTRFLLFSGDWKQLKAAKHDLVEAIDKSDFGDLERLLEELPK